MNSCKLVRFCLSLLAFTALLHPENILAQAVSPSALTGPWDFFNSNDGKRVRWVFAADQSVAEGGRKIGAWTIDGSKLVMTYTEHSDWVDTYDLPFKYGVLHGHNGGDHVLTLAKAGTSLDSVAAAAVPPTAANKELFAGNWTLSNAADGKIIPLVLTGDGRVFKNGQTDGTWQISGGHLVLTYKKLDLADIYDLPIQNGVIHGHNTLGHPLTFASAATSGSKTVKTSPVAPIPALVVSTPAAAAATPAPAAASNVPTNPAPAASAKSGYFGTSGPAITNDHGKTPLTPLATPAASVAMAGNYATGNRPVASASVSPMPTQAVEATPEPVALTPVGKWHWHSGGEHILTAQGAVMQGTNVVGQWKWADKTKGQVQVHMTSGAYRAPTVYTLSPHGNHLTGKSPTSGNEHTEDRIE